MRAHVHSFYLVTVFWHFIFALQYCRDSVYLKSYQMKWMVKEREHLTHQKELDSLMVRELKTSVTRYRRQVYPDKVIVLLFFSILDPTFCQFFFTTEDLNREKAQFSLSMFLECEFTTNQKGSAISLFLPLIHKYWCLHICEHKIPPSVLLSGRKQVIWTPAQFST